jgi:hypothetical protein
LFAAALDLCCGALASNFFFAIGQRAGAASAALDQWGEEAAKDELASNSKSATTDANLITNNLRFRSGDASLAQPLFM